MAPSQPRYPARRTRDPLPQHLSGPRRPPGPVCAHRADTDSALRPRTSRSQYRELPKVEKLTSQLKLVRLRELRFSSMHVVRYIHVSGCGAFSGPRTCMVIRGPFGVTYSKYTSATGGPVSMTVCPPYRPCSHPRRPAQASPGNSAAGAIAGTRSFNSAQAVRAILRAAATSFGGFPASHDPAPRRHPDIAPVLSGADPYPAKRHLRAVLSQRQPDREVAPRVFHRRAWIAEADRPRASTALRPPAP